MGRREDADDARERKEAEAEAAGATWPPEGWVSREAAARMLGVSTTTLTLSAWRWRLRCGKTVRRPGGGRTNIYPLAEIEQVRVARAAAAVVRIPEGFVDADGAARMFGLSRFGWKNWVREGRVRFGQTIASPVGGHQRVYAVADLERLRQELFGEDKLYKDGLGAWHVPAGFIRREEAWERFGVGMKAFERWEREGKITCCTRVPGAPKLYELQEIEQLLEEYGRYCPPYPDPDRPGAYRVPLGGQDIRRREAIIDAESLPLIEGGRCCWGTAANGAGGFVALNREGVPKGTPLRRVIMGVEHSNQNVRHVNGDPLDCRRENLVIRTPRQRSRNNRKIERVMGQPCSSRFKGVSWVYRVKRWQAQIKFEGKTRKIGYFRDEIAAAEAYDEAAQMWFGEHARLNFPDGVDAFLAGEHAEDAGGADETRAAAAA